MKKYAIVAKKDEESIKIENYIANRLNQASWIEDKNNPELVLCVGGDGTFLFAVHKYMNESNAPSFLGIHTGTLGFFTDYTKDEVEQCIEDILHLKLETVEMPLLEVHIDEKDPIYAVNEMRIENIIRTQELTVSIDDQFFENFRGTGMCLCTQAGSTAYNRSLKGAVIDDHLNLMQLQEITGIHHHHYHSLGVPYILNHDRCITFKSDNFENAVLCYDHLNLPLDNVKKIQASISNKTVKLAMYRQIDYLTRIRNLY